MDTQQEDEPLAAEDLLVGASNIRTYLTSIGWPSNIDVYNLKRAGWPIGSLGGEKKNLGSRLVASKRRLARHTDKITRGSTAA